MIDGAHTRRLYPLRSYRLILLVTAFSKQSLFQHESGHAANMQGPRLRSIRISVTVHGLRILYCATTTCAWQTASCTTTWRQSAARTGCTCDAALSLASGDKCCMLSRVHDPKWIRPREMDRINTSGIGQTALWRRLANIEWDCWLLPTRAPRRTLRADSFVVAPNACSGESMALTEWLLPVVVAARSQRLVPGNEKIDRNYRA
jgi:hypothetical protein